MSQSQNKKILQHLKEGKAITSLDALKKYGCFRLSSRIFDLRNDGHAITTTNITKGGKTFAEYSLEGDSNE